MIEVVNLHKSFDDHKVLKGISANFMQGQTNLIIGQSGSGKTVLLKSLVGLFVPEEGEILYNNQDFLKMSKDQKKDIREEIGMLFQGSALFDSLTVEENVRFPLDVFTKLSLADRRERAHLCLKRVNLENASQQLPSEISGGMQKRVAIARAIALNPKYLFCDEPNSGLDPKTAIVIDELIKEITEEYNMTTIINTHDMSSVLGIGDNIIFIYEGEKYWEGSKSDILESDNKILNEFVFASPLYKKVKGGSF